MTTNAYFIHKLIDVAAIQTNGLTLTTQMWDASMVDVENKIMEWHADKFYKNIVRVFATIDDGQDCTMNEMIITQDGVQVINTSTYCK